MEDNEQENKKENNQDKSNQAGDFARQKAQQKVKQQMSKVGQKAGKKMASQLAKQAAKQAVKQGAQAGAKLLLTTPVGWAIIAIIVVIILIFAVVSVVVGAETMTPTCDGLSSSADVANKSNPVMLTLDNCSTQNVIVKWPTPSIGGTYNPSSPTNSPSTTYTPPNVSSSSTITIQADVCSPSDQSKCSSYSIEIVIQPDTCSALGGSCVSSCSSPISGTCTTGGTVCCPGGGGGEPSTPATLKFYCQYDSWNYSGCSISGYGCSPTSLAMIMSSWNTTYTPKYVSSHVKDPLIGESIGCGCGWVSSWGRMSCGTTTNGALKARNWAAGLGYTVQNSVVPFGSKLDVSDLTRIHNKAQQGYYFYVGAWIDFKHSSWRTVCTDNPNYPRDKSCVWPGGHSITIYDADPVRKTILYYDPTYCVDGTKNRPIPREMSASRVSSFYYIYPIKK